MEKQEEKQEFKPLFDSKDELLKSGYKIIGDWLFAKGQKLKGACDKCGFISDIPFNSIDRANRRVIWTCNRCKKAEAYFVNTQKIAILQW